MNNKTIEKNRWLVVIRPILGGKLGDMGNFSIAFATCGILCIVASGISYTIKPAKRLVEFPDNVIPLPKRYKRKMKDAA